QNLPPQRGDKLTMSGIAMYDHHALGIARQLKSLPIAIFSLSLLAALAPNEARAGYFVTAFAGAPLASYLFGDVSQSTASAADSSVFFTDGTNVYSAEGFAAVDLSTGELHAKAQLNYGLLPGSSDCPNCASPFIFGNASFGDSLTFLGSFSNQV